jgi:NitT/TauT family transport system substrate-binding protein
VSVELIATTSPGAHVSAVLSGDAWGFLGGPEQSALADAKGADLRAVVGLADTSGLFLAAAPDFPRSGDLAEHLRGKRIGVSSLGQTTHQAAVAVLESIGLDPEHDVTLVEGNDQARFAAMKAHQVDVTVAAEPTLTLGMQQGIYGEPLLDFSKVLGRYASMAINVEQRTLDRDGDTVRAVVRAVIKALDIVRTDDDVALRVAAGRFPDVDRKVLKAALDHQRRRDVWSADGTISRAGFARVAKLAAATAHVDPSSIHYDEVVDLSYLP